MLLPGFNAEASLSIGKERFAGRTTQRLYGRPMVTPQGCDTWTAIRCSASVLACGALCATGAGAPACVGCFASLGASDCLSCVQ
jgi:hypothetical protein